MAWNKWVSPGLVITWIVPLPRMRIPRHHQDDLSNLLGSGIPRNLHVSRLHPGRGDNPKYRNLHQQKSLRGETKSIQKKHKKHYHLYVYYNHPITLKKHPLRLVVFWPIPREPLTWNYAIPLYWLVFLNHNPYITGQHFIPYIYNWLFLFLLKSLYNWPV